MSSASTGPVRVGIAGLGRSGWGIHASALTELPDQYQVVAVTDAAADRRQDAQTRFGCKTYETFEAMIGDTQPELIIVATPNQLHAEHAIAALQSGRHVVCEKPMAISPAEADSAIAAAERSGKILAVFQNLRYDPSFLKVREVIASGVLGQIVQIRMNRHSFSRRWDWQTLREFGGGQLNNTGPHLLDQALELFGPAEPEVFCHMARVLASGDAEDHAKVILRAAGAPLVEVEISAACAYPQDHWLVLGSSGSLRGTTSELKWKYVDFTQMPARPVDRTPTANRSYNREELAWQEEAWTVPPASGPGNVTHQAFYRDLYKTLRAGAPLVITPQSVRRQIALLERCHELAGDSLAEVAV